MQPTYIAEQVISSTPSNGAGKSPQMDYLLGAFIMALPVLAAIGFIAHRKHRSSKLRRQIITLERLWLLETKERRS
jgi:hypothetical protein